MSLEHGANGGQAFGGVARYRACVKLGRKSRVNVVWLRALLCWVLILAVEFAQGVARAILLVPRIGDLASRQIGVVTGSLLILGVAWLTVRWIGADSRRQWVAVGALWVVLMVAAEVLLGRVVFGFPWVRVMEDFDPTRGGFLGAGMLVLLLAPLAAARVRGLASARR
jgi:hypothetical protein